MHWPDALGVVLSLPLIYALGTEKVQVAIRIHLFGITPADARSRVHNEWFRAGLAGARWASMLAFALFWSRWDENLVELALCTFLVVGTLKKALLAQARHRDVNRNGGL